MRNELFFLPIAVNEKKHKGIKRECNPICGNDGDIFGNDPISDPKSQSCYKYKEHSRRNVIHFFRLPCLPDLRVTAAVVKTPAVRPNISVQPNISA